MPAGIYFMARRVNIRGKLPAPVIAPLQRPYSDLIAPVVLPNQQCNGLVQALKEA